MINWNTHNYVAVVAIHDEQLELDAQQIAVAPDVDVGDVAVVAATADDVSQPFETKMIGYDDDVGYGGVGYCHYHRHYF